MIGNVIGEPLFKQLRLPAESLSPFGYINTFNFCLSSNVTTSGNMALSINGQQYSQYEAQLVCALRLYSNSEGYTVDEETLGSIISFIRHGFGTSSVPCRGLVSAIQQGSNGPCRTLLVAVNSNRAYWEQEAREIHRRWWNANSQAVQRCIMA